MRTDNNEPTKRGSCETLLCPTFCASVAARRSTIHGITCLFSLGNPALRNGRSANGFYRRMEKVRRKVKSAPDGDRQMLSIFGGVAADGLQAVEAACQPAISPSTTTSSWPPSSSTSSLVTAIPLRPSTVRPDPRLRFASSTWRALPFDAVVLGRRPQALLISMSLE